MDYVLCITLIHPTTSNQFLPGGAATGGTDTIVVKNKQGLKGSYPWKMFKRNIIFFFQFSQTFSLNMFDLSF